MIKALVTLGAELILVAAAIFAADALQDRIDFVPRWLIRLPAVDYSSDDFWTVFNYFLAVHAVVLAATQALRGSWRPIDARRTADELFALATAFAAASLLVFVTTTVAFDPQFVVGIAACAAAAITLIHFAARLMARAAALGVLLDFARAVLRRAFSITGVVILAFAVSPGILAKLFVSNRDVANFITEIRIRIASQRDHDWRFVNAFGGRMFAQPIEVQFPPADPGTIYVLERAGRLLRLPWGRPGEPEVVLDITERVGEVEVENGALGFDFHPEFGRTGAAHAHDVYVYYTSVHDRVQINRLSRFSLEPQTPQQRAASEETLITWNRRNDGFHNGGSVEFGPDGFLYISLGEMGALASYQKLGGAMTCGILRIDVDRRGGDISAPIRVQPEEGSSRGYYIPLDNPFVDVEGALGEYWAIGLRNPFRISFDPANGNLWVGDVGSTVWEEVNLVRRGHNYQFPFIEGNEETGKPRPQPVPGTAQSGPIYTYRHTAYDRAVIGGVVYRSDRYPELKGRYVFGDNYSGTIWTLPATGETVDGVQEIAQANQFAQRGITSFTVSPDGEILVTTLGQASAATGEVLKLVPASEAAAAPAADTMPAADAPVGTDEAGRLYQTNCSRCHGATGDGDGPDAAQMNVPMPDMRSAEFQGSRSDERLHAVIAEGGVPHGLSPMMPPWGKLLSEAEIRAMVEYIRALDGN